MDTKRFTLICGIGVASTTAVVLLMHTIQKLVKIILSE